MSVDPFWSTHLTYAESGRRLGTTRQNVYQCCKRGSIPCDRSPDNEPGVPLSWVEETLAMRARDQANTEVAHG